MVLELKKVKTDRLNVAYRQAGRAGAPKLLLLHGNASSGVFYEPLMEKLADDFDMLAPDMRCFGDSDALAIDATGGMKVFSEDLDAFIRAVGWDKFALLGWSLGGGVAMQYAIDHSEKLSALILQAPLSPFGYGGTSGEDGKKLEPVGIGSGAGAANQPLIKAVLEGDREFAGAAIDGSYVVQGFQIDAAVRERFIDSILKCKVGDDMWQGDFVQIEKWPFVASGTKGVANTMSPKYCDLTALVDIPNKMPILWIYGNADLVVGDACFGDLAILGKMNIIPGYPGEDVYPNQPMVSQTRYVLEKYKAKGGIYKEVMVEGSGHGVMLDNEDRFIAELKDFLK